MRQIHLIMPFSRHHLLQTLIDHYRTMGVILHLLIFKDEIVPDCSQNWIQLYVASIKSKEATPTALINYFLRDIPIIDDDYYAITPDDDMYEPDVFNAIRQMDDPVIVISMKRGYRTPPGLPEEKRYPPNTLIAKPGNMVVGSVGGEQIFVKGSIIKNYRFDESSPVADGLLAIWLKDKYPVRYEPTLFCLFNYFEPGRWEKIDKGIAFGVMVNDLVRLDMCLKQSEIDPSIPCHTIKNPESATKGLNKLLDIISAEGNENAILVHQDMFFRQGWLTQVKEQTAKLPESWVVAGVIGKDMQGRICGKFHDMRIPQHFDTSDIHTFPQPACCFDECVIIVNMKKGFRFDETMPGFDLYGTLCVLQAWESGQTAWVVDAFAEHFCMRSFSWSPDEQFKKNYKWLHDRFNRIMRIDSTAIGEVKEGIRFETSAA